MSSNATPSAFGWDFQVNAAIVLMLENIKEAKSVRVEGKKEDIEITFNDNSKIYSQAKSVVNAEDYTNVRSKLRKAIKTMNEAADDRTKKLIYVTNSPNPFNIENTMYAFYKETILSYIDLPIECKSIIDKYIREDENTNIDIKKLKIKIIPFFTDDLTERYKVIKTDIDDFLYTLNRRETMGMGKELLDIWQLEFAHNSTKSDFKIEISKKDLVWSIIVKSTQLYEDSSELDEYDDGLIEEIIRHYNDLIEDKSGKFEIITKVISDYNDYKKPNKKIYIEEFSYEKKEEYIRLFNLQNSDDEVNEILAIIITKKIINNRYLINEIYKKVNL